MMRKMLEKVKKKGQDSIEELGKFVRKRKNVSFGHSPGTTYRNLLMWETYSQVT